MLAILPDGLSDVELLQSNIPIENILKCKATLLSTSLAYQDNKKRLRSLMPIREHVQRISPPSQSLIQCLSKHFYSILELYEKYHDQQLRPVVNQITENLANLQEFLRQGLNDGHPNLVDTIYCTVFLNSFHRVTGRGRTVLLDDIPPIFPQPCDHRLETSYLIEVLLSYTRQPNFMPEQLIAQVMNHFKHFNDPALEGEYPLVLVY
jgi:hypothetical protein